MAGKPIYLELSSVNPVVFLPGAIHERGEALAAEFSGSCLLGTGQFCTNPGMVLLMAGAETEAGKSFPQGQNLGPLHRKSSNNRYHRGFAQ